MKLHLITRAVPLHWPMLLDDGRHAVVGHELVEHDRGA